MLLKWVRTTQLTNSRMVEEKAGLAKLKLCAFLFKREAAASPHPAFADAGGDKVTL
jgi:hypothetical protein